MVVGVVVGVVGGRAGPGPSGVGVVARGGPGTRAIVVVVATLCMGVTRGQEAARRRGAPVVVVVATLGMGVTAGVPVVVRAVRLSRKSLSFGRNSPIRDRSKRTYAIIKRIS